MIQINKIFFIIIAMIFFNSMMTMNSSNLNEHITNMQDGGASLIYSVGRLGRLVPLHMYNPFLLKNKQGVGFVVSKEVEKSDQSRNNVMNSGNGESSNLGEEKFRFFKFIPKLKKAAPYMWGFCTGANFYILFPLIPEYTGVKYFQPIKDNLKISSAVVGGLMFLAMYKIISKNDALSNLRNNAAHIHPISPNLNIEK